MNILGFTCRKILIPPLYCNAEEHFKDPEMAGQCHSGKNALLSLSFFSLSLTLSLHLSLSFIYIYTHTYRPFIPAVTHAILVYTCL